MREAEIICVCEQIRIKDRGLVLTRGQTVWMNHADFHKSPDMIDARRMGAVNVLWKERARVTRPPPPPNFRKLRPNLRKQVTEGETKVVNTTTVVHQAVDTDALAKQVRAAVAEQVSAQMVGMKESLAEEVVKALSKQPPPPGIDMEALAALVGNAVKGAVAEMPAQQVVVHEGAVRAKKPDSHGTLYIPTGIVEEDTKGKVEVQVAASESDGVDDAAAALKLLRKRKKDS